MFPYGEKYEQKPIYAMLYAQDKLEMRDFVINAGLRYDYLNSEVEYWPDVINKVEKVKSSSKYQISPRLGVSHPISENSIIRFNYGYFFQVPNYRYMYTNLDGDVNTGLPLVGNPDLRAEKTIAYELGLNHMVNQDLRLDVTVYYKDVKDLIATRAEYLPGSITPVTRFVNDDYGSVKGLDITLEKVARGNFSGALVYSYMPVLLIELDLLFFMTREAQRLTSCLESQHTYQPVPCMTGLTVAFLHSGMYVG